MERMRAGSLRYKKIIAHLYHNLYVIDINELGETKTTGRVVNMG